ncbi:MAG TPA: prolyl oligopeptidase family serine peptidase [Stellaceae bacterium]|nr:prolyl oligopeptidase family serine peptidase [Stellaceae bacterium]
MRRWPDLTASALAVGLACGAAAASDRPVHRFLDIAVSPDGSRAASVEGDAPPAGYDPLVRTLTIRRLDGGAAVTVPLPCGAETECWPGSPAWTPDGRHLAFALRKPGSHARSLYQVDADGGTLKQLLAFDGTIIGLAYAPDGRLAMLATAGATKEIGATQPGAPVTGDLGGPVPEQRIAILHDGKLDWASPPDLFVYEYDWRPDGSGFVGTAAPGDGDDNWWVAKLYAFDAAGGAGRVIYTPPDGRHQLAQPKISRDGRRIAFISGVMSDFGSTGGDVYTVPVSGGAAVDLTPGARFSATALGWGCDGTLLADVLAGDERRIASLGDGTAPATPRTLWHGAETFETDEWGIDLACPSGIAAVAHESITHGPEIAAGRIGAWKDITSVNAGPAPAFDVRSITWQSEGAEVQGWLELPKGKAGKLPMITIIHGGPGAAATPTFTGPGIYETLLGRGYALFRPNPRGSFGQGEAFAAGNVRDLAAGPFRDILAGVDAALRAGPIDPARLGVFGGSYGGYMTMWAVTQTDRFKAAVAAAGISNLQSYYGENGIDQWMIPYFGKPVYDDPAAYAAASPITFIRNARTPTFAYVGALDIECPAPQTQEFWHALHELGVPTSYAIYPGEGHRFRDPADLADAERRTVEWFDKYLKP